MRRTGAIWLALCLAAAGSGSEVLRRTSVAGNALGDVFYPGDLSSVPLNPSGGLLVERSQVQASYTLLYGGARYNVLGYGDRVGHVGVSLLMSQLYRDGIEVREQLGGVPTTASLSHTGVMLSGALRAPLGVVAGLGIKTVSYEACGVRSPWAVGVDAGVYRPMLSVGSLLTNRLTLNAGAAAINLLAPRIRFDAEAETPATEVRLSLNGSLTLAPRYDLVRETLAYDTLGVYCDYTSRGPAAGAEYRRGNIAVRAGWAPGTYSGYTLGFGTKLGDVALNYAFVPFVGVGVHALDVAYAFGEPRRSADTPAELEDMLVVQRKAERIHDRCVREAGELIRAQRYAAARELLVRVIPARPDTPTARQMLTVCETALAAQRIAECHTAFTEALREGLYPDGMDAVLAALQVSPTDPTVREMVQAIRRDRTIPPAQRSLMRAAERRYVEQMVLWISTAVGTGDFSAAEAALERLRVLQPESQEVFDQKQTIAMAKRQQADMLIRGALAAVRDGNYHRAYRGFAAAYRITGDDAVRIQRDAVAARIPRPMLYDELYARKLYYASAAAFATDETAKARESFFALREHHPTYDTALLHAALVDTGVIGRFDE